MSQGILTVLNVNKISAESYHWQFYCGRNPASCPRGMIYAGLGNPYRIDGETTRTGAIKAFAREFDAGETDRAKEWRHAVNWMIKAVWEGERIALYCHCKPKACHCDVLQNRALQRAIFQELTFYDI